MIYAYMPSNSLYFRRYKPWLFPFKTRKLRNLAQYPGSRKHPLQHPASCPLPLTLRPLSFLPCLSVAGKAMTTENSQQLGRGWPVTTQRPSPSLLTLILSSVSLESSPSIALSKLWQSSVTTYLRTPFRLQLRTVRLCLTTISCNPTWFFLLFA